MHDSVMYWLSANYKKTGMAADASPVAIMKKSLSAMFKQWTRRFNKVSSDLAKAFVNDSKRHADTNFSNAMKKSGFTIKFQMTEEMDVALNGSIAENVGLIKSIPEKYLTQVQTIVLQSVQRGHDLARLTDDLQREFGVTRRRAKTIARDQTNKANSVITVARSRAVGITHGIWVHSGGGKVPRQSHLKAGREKMVFDLSKGAYIDGEYIFPGQLINCRCRYNPIMPWEMIDK